MNEQNNKPSVSSDLALAVGIGLIAIVATPILLFAGAMIFTFGAIQYSDALTFPNLLIALAILAIVIYLLSRPVVIYFFKTRGKLLSKVVIGLLFILFVIALIPQMVNYLKNG